MSDPVIEKDFIYIENENTEIFEITDSPPGPKGDKGDKGDRGDPATIAVGSTTTVANPSPAQVTNSGSPGAAVLNFTLPAGPIGPQGLTGAKGDSAAASFVYEQVTPAATWYINHNLDFFPAVTVVDSGGSDVVGSISYVNRDNLVVTFSVAFGGKAFLS